MKTSTDKDKIKFLLLEGIHPSAVDVLNAAGYTEIESLPGALALAWVCGKKTLNS